jgi:hypothetical protein
MTIFGTNICHRIVTLSATLLSALCLPPNEQKEGRKDTEGKAHPLVEYGWRLALRDAKHATVPNGS